MLDFTNKEMGDVEGKKDGGGAATFAIPEIKQQKRVKWDSVTDRRQAERASILADYQTPETTKTESFIAGIESSVIAAAIRRATAPEFDKEDGFSVRQVFQEDPDVATMGFSEEELSYMGGAVSVGDYNFRKQKVKTERLRQATMSANVVTGIVGAIAGDAPLFIPQMWGAQASKLAMAVRAVARAGEMGTTFYASREFGQSPEIIGLIAGIIGADQLWDARQGVKAIREARRLSDLKKIKAKQAFEDKANAAAAAMSGGKKGAFKGASDEVVEATQEAAPKIVDDATEVVAKPADDVPVVDKTEPDPDLTPIEVPPKKKRESKKYTEERIRLEELEAARVKRVKAKKRAANKAAKAAKAAKASEVDVVQPETATKVADDGLTKQVDEAQPPKKETPEEQAQREWDEAEAEEARREAEANGWSEDDIAKQSDEMGELADDMPDEADYDDLYDDGMYDDSMYEATDDVVEEAQPQPAGRKPVNRIPDRMGEPETGMLPNGKKYVRQNVIVDRTPNGVDVDSPNFTRELDASGIPVIDDASYNSLLDEEFDTPIVAEVNGKFRIEVNKETFVRMTRDRVLYEVGRGWMSKELGDMYLKVLASINESQFVGSYKLSAGILESSWVTTAASKADSSLTMNFFGKEGTEIYKLRDMLDYLAPEVMMHELIHTATARSLQDLINGVASGAISKNSKNGKLLSKAEKIFENAKAALKGTGLVDDYAFTDLHEFLAQTMGDKRLLEELSKLPSVWKHTEKNLANMLTDFVLTIAELLGMKTERMSLATDALYLVDMFKDMNKAYMTGKMNVIETMSYSFGDLVTKSPATTEAGANKRLWGHVKDKLKQSFALYDNIASGDEGLAKLLVSDATSTSAREPSVVDLKRNLELEMNLSASVVEKSIEDNLRRNYSITGWDMFWNRKKFTDAKAAVEEKLTHYLQQAYDAERRGLDIPTPPDEIEDLVEAYVSSGWARKWRQHLIDSGLAKADDFPESDFYIPRQYSHARLHTFPKEDVIEVMSLSLKDRYVSLPPDLVGRIANSWYIRVLRSGQRAKGMEWREMIHGMDENDIFFAMRDIGIPDEQIRKFINTNTSKSGATGKVKNLNSRAGFDMFKPQVLKSGRVMRLSDLMQTNTLGLMQGYTQRMSGRAAFAMKGITDMSDLVKMIDNVTEKSKPSSEWHQIVNDTINSLLGMHVGGDAGEWIRGASNFANSVMLKNSGLYQITDLSIGIKEYGLGRVLKAMMNTKLMASMEYVVNDNTLRGRLHNILNGAYQNEARFRFLTTHADDNLDLGSASAAYMATHNISQGARIANGFSAIHRGMVNLYSNLVADSIDNVLKNVDDIVITDGKVVAKGHTATDLRVLREAGMSDELLIKLRNATVNNPDGVFEAELQRQLEVVGTRVMDYMIQNIRTGETSHFAQFNPVGKVVVGYQSFAVAATNKILRRHTANDDMTGLAVLAAYQLPMMLLATQTKIAMDNREVEPKDLVSQAVLNMSLFGGATLLSPMFSGEPPRHSLASMAFVMQSMAATRDILSGDADLKNISKVVPFAQEFMGTRILINYLDED